MATVIWRGDAAPVAQVNTVTPGGTIGTETFTVTINGKDITYTASGGDTVADVVDGLVAAFNASTFDEFEEITATDSTTHMTLTHDTAGTPFTQTSSATGSATNVTATSTAATGPNHYDDADNWSGGAVPVNSDDVVIENSDVDILYGLDQSAVTLTSFLVEPSYTGNIGLPRYNGDYVEYRDRYLTIKTSTFEYKGGGGRCNIDLSSTAVNALVESNATRAEQTWPAIALKGSSITSLVVCAGDYAVAYEGGDTSTVTTLVHSGDATEGRLGAGTGITTVKIDSGNLYGESNLTTLEQTGGTYLHDGTATLGTVNGDAGTLDYRSTGTLSLLNVGSEHRTTFDAHNASRTVSDCHAAAGATIEDRNRTVTWTAGINLFRCGPDAVTLELGEHLRLTPAAYS